MNSKDGPLDTHEIIILITLVDGGESFQCEWPHFLAWNPGLHEISRVQAFIIAFCFWTRDSV